MDRRTRYFIKADDWNWIVMSGTEVIDIQITSEDIPRSIYDGCRCSSSNDPEIYNVDLGKITCPYKDACCNRVLGKLKINRSECNCNFSPIELIHKDIVEENQFLKKKNDEIIMATKELKKSLETLKDESRKDMERWQNRFYNLQYKIVQEKIEARND